MALTITKKESLKRKRNASILDNYDGPCECCGKEKKTFQDDDYAWICNFCYWTRTDRQKI